MVGNDNKSPDKMKNTAGKIKGTISHAWFKVIGIILAIILVIGGPIVINELYKTGKGYITLWGAEDMLSYYGTILGAVATVLAVIFTIRFTKKQIQRENYLHRETDKWVKIEAVFADILNQLNPIVPLQSVMDTGFTAPDKAINILQKYQMTCRTITDCLSTSLSTVDYPKVKNLVETIQAIAEQYFIICGKQIEQYILQRKLALKDSAIKILELAEKQPGSPTKEQLSEYQEMVDAANGIQFEKIEKTVQTLNENWIKLYKVDYRNLLMQKGSTFDGIYTEIQKNADEMLRLRRKP